MEVNIFSDALSAEVVLNDDWVAQPVRKPQRSLLIYIQVKFDWYINLAK